MRDTLPAEFPDDRLLNHGKRLFDRKQFALLADRLAQIEGRFVLSINDTPETRAAFDRFDTTAVSTTYTVSRQKGTQARELISIGRG